MRDTLALDPSRLYHACDPDQFSFDTTAELDGLDGILGQTRAMDAVQFGAGMRHDGYNLFVLGPSGMGKRSMVRQILERKALEEQAHADWCYVNNFAEPHKPRAIRLPTGRGAELRAAMRQIVEYLRTSVPGLFESEDYHAKTQAVQEEFTQRQEKAFQELGSEAQKQEVVLLRTPGGFAFAPAKSEEVMPPDEYQQLPEEKRKQLESVIAELQERLEKILRGLPQSRKELSERIKQLHRDIMLSVVEHLIDDVRKCFGDQPAVLDYLNAVQQDMVERVDDFRKQEATTGAQALDAGPMQAFPQYQVNVLVTNGHHSGAPIVSEDNPTYANLVGRVEHLAQMGALVTNFTLIKPGALHQANGGYLLLDVQKVLSQPFAWEGLKRALKAREIRIESLGQAYSLVSTVSLEPEPIPLHAKIVLFGDRMFYYLLQQYDQEFGELFKVAADFEEEVERNHETHLLYARLIATLTKKDSLLPFDRTAVARVIEHGARLAGDAERMSAHMRSVADLLRESDYWARQA